MALYRSVGVVLTTNGRGLTTGLRAAAAEVQGFARSVESANATAAKGTAAWTTWRVAALAGAGALAYSIDKAVKFDVAMRNVNSLLQVNAVQFAAMENNVIAISKTTPQSAEQLAKGLYDIASSGFQGTAALNVLKTSAVAATAGVSDTATAVRAISAAINAYGLSANDAQDVSDTLFQTVNVGIVTFSELATNLGDVIGPAAQARVNLGEVGAAIAAMTLAGITGAESVTSLARLIQHLVKPSAEMAAVFKSWGFESGQAALDTLGLHGVMERLQQTTHGNVAEIYTLTKDVRAARGALTLMANDGQNYNRTFAAVADTNGRVGATQKAFREQMKAAGNQLQLLRNDADAIAITLGTHLLPYMTAAIKGVEDFGHAAKPTVDGLTPFLSLLVQLAKYAAEIGGGALLQMAKGFGLLPSPIQAGTLALLAFTALRPRFASMTSETSRLGRAIDGLQRTLNVGSAANDKAFQDWSRMTPAMRRLGTEAANTAPKMGSLARGVSESGKASTLLARAGSGLLGVFGGPWGLAVTGAAIAMGVFAAAHARAQQRVKELTAAIEEDNGVLGEHTAKLIVDNLQSSGAIGYAKDLGISVETLTKAALGAPDALAQVNAMITAARTVVPINGIQETTVEANKLAAILGTQSGDLAKASIAGQDYTNAMSAASGSMNGASTAATASDPNIARLEQTLSKAGVSADSAANGTEKLAGALATLAQPALDARSAVRDYYQAVDDADAAAKKNGRTLDVTKQKGRDNADALDKIASSANKAAAAMLNNGTSQDVVKTKVIASRHEFERVAERMGLSKRKADILARRLISWPKVVHTTVSVDVAAAMAHLNALKAGFSSIQFYAHQRDSGPTAQPWHGGRIRNGLVYRSYGGPVFGQGTATSDSIPAMLSNGEYVVNARSAARFGYSNLDTINRYASGGKVSASERAAQRRENARLRVTASGRGDGSIVVSFDSSSAVGGAQDYYDTRGQAAAQLRANLTKNPNDTPDDYFRRTRISANGYTKVLATSVSATRTWSSQLTKIASTTGGDVASSLERMGEQGKDAVRAMATATTKDARRMADALRALDFAKFTADIGGEAAGRAAFQANLIALVKMGRSDLASQLAQMGYEQGGTLAAAAVKSSGASLASLASKIASINSTSDDKLSAGLQLAAALMASGGKLGIIGLANATGLDVGDVFSLINTSSIFKSLPSSALTQVRIDQALIAAGKQPTGMAAGGIVTGSNTGLYYRWAEQGSGGESLIPHNNTARSRALWEQTGRILGMPGYGGGSGTTVTVSAPISVRVDRAGATAEEIADAVEGAVDSTIGDILYRYKAGSR